MDFQRDLDTLIMARNAVISVETFEEDRITDILKSIAERQKMKIATWSCTEGLLLPGAKHPEEATEDPESALGRIAQQENTLTIMYDLHKPFMDEIENPTVTRKLREVAGQIEQKINNIVIVTPAPYFPTQLLKIVTMTELPLPTIEELDDVLTQMLNDFGLKARTDSAYRQTLTSLQQQLENGNREGVVNAARGITLNEFRNVISRGAVLNTLTPRMVNDEKRQIVHKSGLLEFVETVEGTSSIGGLEILKHNMSKTKKRFTKEALAFGLEPPRGILLAGPPGTGKSLSVQVAAYYMNLPLIRLDMSDVVSKWLGETASKFKQAIRVVTATSPNIWWWDEAEKMFSTGGQGEGHEEIMRLLATLLTDFEENKAPIVRYATCNHPELLKAEFISRFEQLYFIDLPTPEEQQQILSIWLKKISRDPVQFDIPDIVKHIPGYVGREIRNIVKLGLTTAFDEGTKLSTDHLIIEAAKIKPMSKQRPEDVEEVRRWGEKNAVNASRLIDTGFTPAARAISLGVK